MAEYAAFLRATGGQILPDEATKYALEDQHPAVAVTWDEANAYCQWTSKQLPTEAQWEKAARGTDGRRYPWGNEAVDGKRANYCDARCGFAWKDKEQDDGYPDTAPVGSYPLGKSPYGIEDLAGNVWEWVQDWHDAGYYSRSPERNPVNVTPGMFRVLRGGSWFDNPADVRAADRSGFAPGSSSNFLGFRCVVAAASSRR
jgi:formylglycine-generating enzyme required for sulfatase activity